MAQYLNNFEEAIQTDFNNPGSLKSGEYLYSSVQNRAERFIEAGMRGDVVAVVRTWLCSRTEEPTLLLAVTLSKNLSLHELLSELHTLNNDVLSGKFLEPYFSEEWIAPAIQFLSSPDKN